MEQMELLKMKNRISAIKISLAEIYSKLCTSKEKITNLVNTAIKLPKIKHSQEKNDLTTITKKDPNK